MKNSKTIRRLAVLTTCLICLAALTLSLSSCNSPEKNGLSSADSSNSADVPGAGEETAAPKADDSSLVPVTLDAFKEAASAYGIVTDTTEQLAFESAAVQNGSFTLIYMRANTPEQAEDFLTDGGKNEVTALRSGSNYTYYEEISPSGGQSSSDSSHSPNGSGSSDGFYGYYLRIENVLLLVTGSPSDEKAVRETAETLFRTLGCTPAQSPAAE